MSVIYNFNELVENERQQFAADLVKKINEEHIFSSEVDFKIDSVEADEMSGDLAISVSHDGYVEISRSATWQSSDEDSMYSPEEPDYENTVYDDAEKAFSKQEAEIDGYKVSLVIDDADDDDTLDVEVDDYSHEDSGIGHYEYWGQVGYDSHPYVEVEGTIIRGCTCHITFWVEPIE